MYQWRRIVVKDKFWKLKSVFSTTQIIVIGFLLIIFFGTLVLMLPISSESGQVTNFVDALFTATTCVCVTGLVTLPTFSYWSAFGKLILLILIQFGGLGFMTCFTTILLLLKKRVTLRERMVIQDSLNESGLTGVVKLVKKIIKGTILVEGLGALFFCFKFIPLYGVVKGIWISVFTAISAFCNAGVDMFGADSMVPFQNSYWVSFISMLLIISGGIGFTVWWDIIKLVKVAKKNNLGFKKNVNKLPLHSKLALILSTILILGGAVFFLIAEYNNPETIGTMSIAHKIQNALFQSVTTRTAGFMTIYQDKLTISSQFMTIILMFIGGSPAGTAGGIKTVTFGVVMLSVISVVKGKERTEAFHRTLPSSVTRKALAILVISIFVLISGTMLLSVTEHSHSNSFMLIMFEVTSALATVGLTQGLTPNLTILGKLLIIILMFIGRIGPISMALMFSTKRKKTNNSIKLPEENVIVG